MPRVSELLMVAGPSCCGKTRFLDRVFDGRHDDLMALMGVSDRIQSYTPVLAIELPEHRGASIPRMILHLALPVVPLVEGSLERICDEPRFDFVRTCESVTAITLVASGGVLQSRLRSRYRWSHKLLLKSVPEYLSVRKRLGKLIRTYEDPANLVLAYEAWFRYLESLPNLANRWLITTQDEYELREPAEWREIRNSYFGPSPELALPNATPHSMNHHPKNREGFADGTK